MFLFYSLVSLIPILSVWSLFLLRKWQLVYKYIFVNTLVCALYSYVILYAPLTIFAQDPLGLKKIFLFLTFIFIHAVGSFIFAVYYHYKLSKNGNGSRSLK
jgi:hypothetical protein